MNATAGGNGGLLWSLAEDRLTFDSLDPRFHLGEPIPPEGTDGLEAVARGSTVFRGSAIRIGDSVLGLIGPHGAGTSTCAAVLAARGHTLVADGVLEIESESAATGVHLNNRSTHISMWADTVEHFGFEPVERFESGVAKFRWTPSSAATDAEAVLSGVILLGAAAGIPPALTAPDPKTALLSLAQSQVAQTASVAVGRVPLVHAQQLMSKVPVRAVNRSESLDLVEATAEPIERWAAALAPNGGSGS